ncbi:MAG: hypothetical protein KF906_11685 [Actinobacteria bacterium]|nr:hypothetical protein [Actinomycetota bacterium]
MRVLHLQGDDGRTVDLHAGVTVVGSADPDERARIVGAFVGLVAPGDVVSSGLVEVRGIRFDVSGPTRELLGLEVTPDAAGGAPPLVVGAEDLPGHDAALVTARAERDVLRRRRDLAAEELDRRRADLSRALARRDEVKAELAAIERGEGAARAVLAAAGAERSRLEFELEVARDERARFESELSEALLARDALRNEHDKVRAAVATARARRAMTAEAAATAEASLQELRSQPPTEEGVDERLADARDRLAAAEAVTRDLDPDGEESPLARQLAALGRRWADLVQRGAALGEPDARNDIVDALEALVAARGDGLPVVQALALADTWRDLHQQIDALDIGLTDEELEAEARVRRAERAVLDAQAVLNRPSLTSEQIARVEAAHQAVLAGQDLLDRRIGRKRRQVRLEQLRDEEQTVLHRLGFETYADYMMSTSNRGTAGAEAEAEERAQGELAEAMAALDEVAGANDRARRRAELLDRKREVAPRITDLLGYEPTGPETEEDLRNLRQEGEPRPEDLARLAAALEAADVAVGEGPWEREDLVLLARSFLAEDQEVADERVEVAEATAALESSIADLRVQRNLRRTDRVHLLSLPPLAKVTVESTTDAARAWDEVEAVALEVTAAEEAVVRRRTFDRRTVELTGALMDAQQLDEEAAIALASAELERRPEQLDRLTSAADRIEMAEGDLARGREVEADVTRRITERSRSRAVHDLAGAVADRLLVAEDELSSAAEGEQSTAAEVALVEADVHRLTRLVVDREAHQAAVDRTTLVNDVEWALLSRLANLRNVGLAGALPLVLDDPFGVLDDEEVTMVLDRLVRLAQTSQIVIVTERPSILAWAAERPDDEVAVT